MVLEYSRTLNLSSPVARSNATLFTYCIRAPSSNMYGLSSKGRMAPTKLSTRTAPRVVSARRSTVVVKAEKVRCACQSSPQRRLRLRACCHELSVPSCARI